jgi:hypothetical protein
MGTDMKHSSAQDEAQWYLLKYQKGQVFLLRNNRAVIERNRSFNSLNSALMAAQWYLLK